MEVTVLNKEDNILEIALGGINGATANTLRRLMIGEVPVMAIKEIKFSKNTSALYDEILAHRLGLIPLKTDLESYNLEEGCKCSGKGCARCQTKISLKINGPITVYAKNLDIKDPAIKPVYPDMPIVDLLKNQKLELEAIAVLGKGIEHTKFSPGLVYYRSNPKVKVNNNLKNADAVHKSCPVNVFTVKNNSLKVKNEGACILCNACVDVCDPEGAVTVGSSEKDFIMTIESWGQLSPKEMFKEAVRVFDDKLNTFKKELKKAK